ncbi:MAG: hypothetical protein DHS20C14_22300 [Phycisphaeraceae bacterium]|nr:MAG: hypothetical protein DHS20C14_22300 [Phycisphaeraceae bacterium]
MIEPAGLVGLVAPRLVTGEGAPGGLEWGWVGLAVAAVGVVFLCVLLVRRSRDNTDCAERAGHRIAKLVGLDDRERGTLVALARASGSTPTPAMMLSRRVFRGASARAAETKRPPKPAAIESLERRLFGAEPVSSRRRSAIG